MPAVPPIKAPIPIPIKTAMNYLGLCKDTMRLPLSPMNSVEKEKLTDKIEKFKDIIY